MNEPARRRKPSLTIPTPFGLPDIAAEQALAGRIGISFANPLLGAFVAEYLYVQDREADEGALTRRRARKLSCSDTRIA